MNALEKLKSCQTRIDLALLLKCKPSFLTYLLFKTQPQDNYSTFEVKKKGGGVRTICAPVENLKGVQRSLSELLLDCIDVINNETKPRKSLAHGFVRNKSIITNAETHKGNKNVLNIDLENFFGEFNFGRVRGFFIKNRHFELNPNVATVIAQLSCFNNELPQGSPCSPVISNLITHALDVRLANLAKRNSCIYTRYADDITFSTRLKTFPTEIMGEPTPNEFVPSPELTREISRAGFKINHKKTRIQYKESRQDVTGIVVNKKLGIKREYRQLTKAMCHSLFHRGSYTILKNDEYVEGTMKELEGRLNFIDSVDFYNRTKHPEKLNIHYQPKNHGLRTRQFLNSREKMLSKFLFYKYFVANEKTTILCEGKTDNIYIKTALRSLAGNFPQLAQSIPYESNLDFINYSKRTRFFLEIFGGTPYLCGFITNYLNNYTFYKAAKKEKPVIIVLDNDDGLTEIVKALNKIDTCEIFPNPQRKIAFKDKIKNAEYIHVCHNLYIVLTPLDNGKDTMIEHFFEQVVWKTQVHGRVFDPTEKLEPKKNYYGKNVFATDVVRAGQKQINFDGFNSLFERLQKAISHYDSL